MKTRKRQDSLSGAVGGMMTSRAPNPRAALEVHEAYLTYLSEQLNRLHQLDPAKDIDFVTAFVILQQTNVPQKHLAAAVGISPATMSRWAKGHHLPERVPVRTVYLDEVAKAMAVILAEMPKRPGTKPASRSPRRPVA